jgi:hypothetical protein
MWDLDERGDDEDQGRATQAEAGVRGRQGDLSTRSQAVGAEAVGLAHRSDLSQHARLRQGADEEGPERIRVLK